MLFVCKYLTNSYNTVFNGEKFCNCGGVVLLTLTLHLYFLTCDVMLRISYKVFWYDGISINRVRDSVALYFITKSRHNMHTGNFNRRIYWIMLKCYTLFMSFGRN